MTVWILIALLLPLAVWGEWWRQGKEREWAEDAAELRRRAGTNASNTLRVRFVITDGQRWLLCTA